MALILRVATRSSLALLPARSLAVQVQQRRSFFGMGEILGVIANPAETIRQLNESKELLRKAKEDLELRSEAKKIPKKHTFAKLPGFHGRKTELELLRKILSKNPKLSIIFGATSVGKTALLREVLATDDYFVIKFDLRISGFADLRTLYVALCEQFERFFEEMKDEEMGKSKLVFKHMILALSEKEKEEGGGYQVSVADIASLMEALQSCLLRYWEYDPVAKKKEEDAKKNGGDVKKDEPKRRVVEEPEPTEQSLPATSRHVDPEVKEMEEDDDLFKKRPVVFLMDEAHKLPALVDDTLVLKVFLDTLLVLTKQDRLCHVILSTSDSFFHHFLRSMNVGHHAQIMTVGDCTKEETFSYLREEMMPLIPDHLKSKVDFEEIYEAFGGKLSHISDYLSSWVNEEGDMTPYTSAIFTQAYTLLQFHLTHTKFETFSPLSTATSGTSTEGDEARFTRNDLLYVIQKLVEAPYSMPYFTLCREVGTAQVDSMIKTRILELRWTKTISPEDGWIERKWSEDGIERPIVLPMTRIVRKAMEVVLKEEQIMSESDESPIKAQAAAKAEMKKIIERTG